MSWHRDPYNWNLNHWWMRPIYDEPLFNPGFRRRRSSFDMRYPEMVTMCPAFTRDSNVDSTTKYRSHHKSMTTKNTNGVVVSEEIEEIEHENGEKETRETRIVNDKKVTKTRKTDKDGKVTENTNYENCNELEFNENWLAITEN